MRFTEYFQEVRRRPDRALIRIEWIGQAVRNPIREQVQRDGRVRRWTRLPGDPPRYLRVILLEDRVTVHNAFIDRRFRP